MAYSVYPLVKRMSFFPNPMEKVMTLMSKSLATEVPDSCTG